MSAIGDFTSLVWWLMLLSSTAIILHDLAGALAPSPPKPTSVMPTRTRFAVGEDEYALISRKVRRGIEKPANFRSLQKEVAQSIWQLALATGSYDAFKTEKPTAETIERVIKDDELADFLQKHLTGSDREPVRRGDMLSEVQRTIQLLENAELKLK